MVIIMTGSFLRMFKLPKMMVGIVVNRKTLSQIQKTVFGREKWILFGESITESQREQAQEALMVMLIEKEVLICLLSFFGITV